MQMDIFEQGEPVGTLQIRQEGLYKVVEATCRPHRTGVLRLYLWQGTQGGACGVLCPAGDSLRLSRKLSAAALPFMPEQAVIGCAEGEFLPWRGSFEGAFVEDGFLRQTQQGPCIAVVCREGMQYPFAHRLTQTVEQQVGAVTLLTLCPWLPAEPAEEEALPFLPAQAEETAQEPAVGGQGDGAFCERERGQDCGEEGASGAETDPGKEAAFQSNEEEHAAAPSPSDLPPELTPLRYHTLVKE